MKKTPGFGYVRGLDPGTAPYYHPDSPMHGWPLIRRLDSFSFGLLEAICPHGVGHPIPESIAFLERAEPRTAGTWGVHGCDGCCLRKETQGGPV